MTPSGSKSVNDLAETRCTKNQNTKKYSKVLGNNFLLKPYFTIVTTARIDVKTKAKLYLPKPYVCKIGLNNNTIITNLANRDVLICLFSI